MKIEQFRQSRADDLKIVAKILETTFSNINTSPVLLAAEDCLKESPRLKDGSTNADYWGYEIVDLLIPVDTVKHLRPLGVDKTKVELILNMKIIADFKEWDNLNDPLIDLSFNVVIRGIGEKGPQLMCFHIDKHDMSKVTDEPHPVYHLQFASNPYDSHDFNYGDTLHLDTPRINHHPLDLILGLGFLTINFFPMAFEMIMENGYYPGLYKKYQEKILQPYFHTIANQWDFDTSKIVWNPISHLCPFLI
jgi:hypothetical protein